MGSAFPVNDSRLDSFFAEHVVQHLQHGRGFAEVYLREGDLVDEFPEDNNLLALPQILHGHFENVRSLVNFGPGFRLELQHALKLERFTLLLDRWDHRRVAGQLGNLSAVITLDLFDLSLDLRTGVKLNPRCLNVDPFRHSPDVGPNGCSRLYKVGNGLLFVLGDFQHRANGCL